MLLALLACHGAGHSDKSPSGDGSATEDTDTTEISETDTEVDTGSADPRPAATWSSGIVGGWEGQELEAGTIQGEAVVLVGAPLVGEYLPEGARTTALGLGEGGLRWLGALEDPSGDGYEHSDFGAELAITADGTQFAVGAMLAYEGPEDLGAVYLFSELPNGATAAPADAHIIGDNGHRTRLGISLEFMDLSGDGQELVTAASSADVDIPGQIYRFDRAVSGELGLASATASILGDDYRFGQHIARWDSDGDGLDEVATTTAESVVHFPSPWSGDITQAESDVSWAHPEPADQIGEPLEPLGDLDGDGLPELGISAQTYTDAYFRLGALFVVPGGQLVSSAALDVPTRFFGTEYGQGLGSGTASGDFDGDGNLDLAIGAYGIQSYDQPGHVYGYLGPITPAVRTPEDADFTVTGQYLRDLFGVDLVAVDGDGDARADLVVGAQGWNYSTGKVYLFLGADLVP